MSYNVMDVAQFIINYSNESEITITNLKLQKLLYYVQAAFLIETGKPCFEENIINWRHGPVITEVYDEFKSYASMNIDPVEEYSVFEIGENFSFEFKVKKYQDNPIKPCERNIIKKVVNAYKDMGPWELVNRTHEEDPWLIDSERNGKITLESIENYFKEDQYKKRIYGDI